MAILVTGAFGCIGSRVLKRRLPGGERPVLSQDPWRQGPQRDAEPQARTTLQDGIRRPLDGAS